MPDTVRVALIEWYYARLLLTSARTATEIQIYTENLDDLAGKLSEAVRVWLEEAEKPKEGKNA